MLVLTNVLVPNENNNRQNSLPTVRISLNEFVEKHVDQPFQSTFNRHARLPSMLSNIALWFILILTVALFHKEKDHFSFKARLTIGLVILMIIIISYVFILFESNGCIEQILLKKRLQIDLIKRELAFMKKNSKLNSCLLVSATNYFNSLRRKFIDYKAYDQSFCQRLQSFFYHQTLLIETPLNVRSYRLDIPDFSIDSDRLTQIHFDFHLSLVGTDAELVRTDIEHQFRRLEIQLDNELKSNDHQSEMISSFARIQRRISFRLNDPIENDYLFGERRSPLIYQNRSALKGRWFFTENTFWIMTCLGFSWLFRLIFACSIRKVVVPVYVELDGLLLPHNSLRSSNPNKEIALNKTRSLPY